LIKLKDSYGHYRVELLSNSVDQQTKAKSQRAISKIMKVASGRLSAPVHLIECELLTGRQHQLRVHCSFSLNAPILGDNKYSKQKSRETLHLHAQRMELYHPKLWAEPFIIRAPLPQHFDKTLQQVKWTQIFSNAEKLLKNK
jgi:23S rRNA-/tRNA-specific pseudouridylate synthase